MGTNKLTLKIVAATSMSLFSLLTCFSGVWAWFNASRSMNNSGSGFSVYGGSNINLLSCYAVRYDGNAGAIATDLSDGQQSIAMSEYDYIFIDRNVNTPLFLRMEITGFDTSKGLTVTIPCSGTYKNGRDQVNPYLSNVVCAKFMYGLMEEDPNAPQDSSGESQSTVIVPDNYTWTGSSVSNASVVASYQGMAAHAATDEGTPFVVGQSKNSSITLTLDAEDVFDQDFVVQRTDAKGDTVDAVVVYIGLDYYETNSINLITNYITSYGNADHSPSFSADITSITISNEGGESS